MCSVSVAGPLEGLLRARHDGDAGALLVAQLRERQPQALRAARDQHVLALHAPHPEIERMPLESSQKWSETIRNHWKKS